ncbi:MAG: DUF1573 domain-containing protein [Bacteroidaceae bacterium]|nr:DUF1573 domain-containing protein [Bacteroidaceae bacterium]
MKKMTMSVVMLVLGVVMALAQTKAEITFEVTTYDFGTFSENDPKVTCVFKFKNTGNAPLIIHQAVASCGCTVPDYTKQPIKAGESGEIKVTYNGAGRYPGKFRKTITVHSNATNDVVRLYIKGNMTARDIDLQKAIEETADEHN